MHRNRLAKPLCTLQLWSSKRRCFEGERPVCSTCGLQQQGRSSDAWND